MHNNFIFFFLLKLLISFSFQAYHIRVCGIQFSLTISILKNKKNKFTYLSQKYFLYLIICNFIQNVYKIIKNYN